MAPAGRGGGYVGPGEGGAPAAGANDSGAGGDGETEETSAFLQLCAPSAPYAELQKHFGFTVENVVRAAKKQLELTTA